MFSNMQSFSVLIIASLLVVASKSEVQKAEGIDHRASNNTVHFFVLMVPDSSLHELNRGRQEEEAATVTETGAYVGQIISGVLGGDVRPIFAGSASFIDEPDVQQGVSTILANVAPSLNNIVKSWVNRAQTFLGIATTPRPGQVALNQTAAGPRPGQPLYPSYGTIAGQPQQSAALSQAQTALLQQQLAQLQQQYRPQTIPGTNVISGYDLYDPSTVPPLPIIKLKPDDDDEESDSLNKFVKI